MDVKILNCYQLSSEVSQKVDVYKRQVLYKDETVWATQKAMAQLFDCSTDNIGLHLKNIFKSGEPVSYTHLDVYKRQDFPYEGNSLGSRFLFLRLL